MTPYKPHSSHSFQKMKPKFLLTAASFVMMMIMSSCITFEPYQYDENGQIIKDENEKEATKLGPIEIETSEEEFSDFPNPFAFLRPLSLTFNCIIDSFIPGRGTALFPIDLILQPVIMLATGCPLFLGITVLDLVTLGYFEKKLVEEKPCEESNDKSGKNEDGENEESENENTLHFKTWSDKIYYDFYNFFH